MEIKLKNVGIIQKEVRIKLDGLTIITGYNGTGKSTIGKAAYSVVEGISSNKVEITRRRIINRDFDDFYKSFYKELYKIVGNEKILKQYDISNYFRFSNRNTEAILETLKQIIVRLRDDGILESASFLKLLQSIEEKTSKIANINNDFLLKSSLNMVISSEFDDDFINKNVLMENTYIKFIDENIELFSFEKNKKETKVSYKSPLFSNVFYIDGPLQRNLPQYLIDFGSLIAGHAQDLNSYINASFSNKVNFSNEKYEKVFGDINQVLPGKFEYEQGSIKYSKNNNTYSYNSLASGEQSLGIIKILAENALLRENSLLIIDEPENHLHPELQICLAKALVKMVSNYQVKLLITTHSPYFLEALEVYSQKELMDITNFYLATIVDDAAIFKNINDNIDQTYELLAKPFIKLEADELDED